MKASSQSGGMNSIAMSGLMNHLESGGKGTYSQKKVAVGEDDDDSIAEDDWSLDSEESFYVGIGRADYAQPNNFDLYGEEKDEGLESKEDRLGISRASLAIIHLERGSIEGNANKDGGMSMPVHDKSSSLHGFMTGNQDVTAAHQAKKNFFYYFD